MHIPQAKNGWLTKISLLHNPKITNTNHIKNKNYYCHDTLSSPSRKVEHFEVPRYKMRATTKLAQLMPIEKAINLASNFVKISTIEEILRCIQQSLETLVFTI